MRFDVSEMKTASECGRKWQLSSRNAFHLRPKVANPNLFFGSLFHECLHTLYLGGDIDKVVEQAVRECVGDSAQQKVIENMLRGYYDQVLLDDLSRYKVLDIEHSVNFDLPVNDVDPETGEQLDPIHVCGSIDMVTEEIGTHAIWGFEHKTASKFRPDIYLAMDEQPRVYFIELMHLVEQMNIDYYAKYKEPGPYTVGGIFINEVKKSQRKFEYLRRPCKYSKRQMEAFVKLLVQRALRIRDMKNDPSLCSTDPGYLKCQMCDYATICQMYTYDFLDKDAILDEFAEEFEVREVDHLDEKVERRIEG